MPIAYTMKIDTVDVEKSINGHPDTITRAIWTMTGTDGDLTASTSASTEFPAPDEGGKGFTAFADLKEETVIGWVEATADPAYLDSRREIIASEIDKLRDPYVPPKAPWVTEPEVEVSEDAAKE